VVINDNEVILCDLVDIALQLRVISQLNFNPCRRSGSDFHDGRVHFFDGFASGSLFGLAAE